MGAFCEMLDDFLDVKIDRAAVFNGKSVPRAVCIECCQQRNILTVTRVGMP